jgi:hypothetical protein
VFEIYSDSVVNQSQTFSGLVGAIWQVNDKLSFDAAVRYASVDGRPVSELRLGMTFGFPLILSQPFYLRGGARRPPNDLSLAPTVHSVDNLVSVA